jgi:hypothetical protein
MKLFQKAMCTYILVTTKKFHFIGDGRNDSPGHCAQYCSYTIMEQTSKKILTLITLDKRTTDRKSVNMEKVGFAKAMEEMKAKNIEVEEVVTDAHLGIGAIMSMYLMIHTLLECDHCCK